MDCSTNTHAHLFHKVFEILIFLLFMFCTNIINDNILIWLFFLFIASKINIALTVQIYINIQFYIIYHSFIICLILSIYLEILLDSLVK